MQTRYETIQVAVTDHIAVFSMNHPPVNQLSSRFRADLLQAFGEAYQDETVKAIVLTGSGKNFIAGADITELQHHQDKDALLTSMMAWMQFLNRIETGPKAVVAAINGNCLGGGLEIAMCCHFRAAAAGVKLGQPEVHIGLIPGAGGTQRLPRLIGLPLALEMITTGQPISAETAHQRGLVDAVSAPEALLDVALKAAGRFASGEWDRRTRATRNRRDLIADAAQKKAVIDFAQGMLLEKAKGYIAPFKALEAIAKGLSDDMDGDLKREARLFAECAVSDVAKNLIAIFLNTRAAGRLPQIEGLQPATINKAAVLGGGVMGSGIAHLLLKAGFDTLLWDIDKNALDKGVGALRKSFDYAVKKQKMTPADLDEMLAKQLTTTSALEVLADVDLVIEAVVEDMSIKQSIWKKLATICRAGAVFATNTSALPITEMASILDDPGRMIGLHFFNPAQRMKLVEIICAPKTSPQTLATGVAFARRIGKIPVVVHDGPGFYVSRQLGGLMGAAVYLTADGVDGAAIESAMTDFGMPMGPATLSDLTGIDIHYHVYKTFEKRLGPRYTVHPLTEAIYRTGCYGRKTGAGYFDYSGDEPVPNPVVVAVVETYRQENHVAPRQLASQEIIDTMLALGINEAALVIQEGICDRPQDMDLAVIYGLGFPPYRGGILKYADQWGIANVYEKLLALEKRYGPRFQPAELIKTMAASGKTFYPS